MIEEGAQENEQATEGIGAVDADARTGLPTERTVPIGASVTDVPAATEAKALSWAAVFSTYLPALILALGVGIALPAIPVLARSFGVDFGQASFVITAFLAGGLVSTLPTGWLIDRFGRRPVMIAGPILTATMAVLVLTSRTFPELVVFRFLDGWAAQMWVLGRLAGISHGASPNQRGRQVSWMFGMDSSGKLAGPMVGGFIAGAFGARAPFAAYAALALLALVPTIKLTTEVPSRRTAGQSDGTVPTRPSVPAIVLPRLGFFCLALAAAVARGPILADMLHLYAAFAYGLSAQAIGVLATSATAVVLPIGFCAGWVMDRYGRKVTMLPGFASLGVSMVLLAVTAFAHFPFPFYVGAFLLAVVAQGLTGGSIQTIGADVAPPEARGLFLGLWRFTGLVGNTLSPIAFAFLADALGYGVSFVFIAAMALLTVAFVITVVPHPRAQRAATLHA